MTDIESSELKCTIKKIIYSNDENGYFVASTEQGARICGKYLQGEIANLEGEGVILKGIWGAHKKYGSQFEFEILEIAKNELFFFLTKIIKTIPKTTAKAIIKKYSDEELAGILQNNPRELLQFKGIKEKKLDALCKSWNEFKHLRELGAFLATYGVTIKTITKIYEEFLGVTNIVEKIKENPYMLSKVKGIGFKKSDEIALSLGIETNSQKRIMACMAYCLNEICENGGNSSVEKKELQRYSSKTLNFEISDDVFANSIILMIAANDIFETTKSKISPRYLYFAERFILEFLNKRKKEQISKPILKDIEAFLNSQKNNFGFELSEEQSLGVRLINDGAKTLALIGYAGTGKTTSSRAILELLLHAFDRSQILCTALSGIAAQRVSDATGFDGFTIQSLLVGSETKETIDCKAILIDEASMINSVIFYQLLSKLDDDAIVIFVGDDGQLPPIGAGNVFSDIINFDLVPISKLTKIYRQNEDQAIALIANEIRQFQIPNIGAKKSDFEFVEIDGPSLHIVNENIANCITNIASNYASTSIKLINNKEINKFLTLFQVITPMRSGILGVENLNLMLKKIFNPNPKITYLKENFEISLADKVIHIKNENMQVQSLKDYRLKSDDFFEKRVFNGMLGIIIKIDLDENVASVLYPNDDMVVFYPLDDIQNLLSLAYCLTIHKTQGMEYENVAIAMSKSHYIMHNTKLFYTAITRAKKMCFVVGQKTAFENGCKKKDVTKRETAIADIVFASFGNF